MSATATTRSDQYTSPTGTLFVALELGEKDWKLALSAQLDQRPQLRTIRARDRERLLEEIWHVRAGWRADRVRVCYEAGRDGFWLQRFLEAHGIECLIVDSASIEVRRRARRTKTEALSSKRSYKEDLRSTPTTLVLPPDLPRDRLLDGAVVAHRGAYSIGCSPTMVNTDRRPSPRRSPDQSDEGLTGSPS